MQLSVDKLMVFHGKTMEKLPLEMFPQNKGDVGIFESSSNSR